MNAAAHLSIGSTMDEFAPPVAKGTRADGFRQAASGDVKMFVSAVLHPFEILSFKLVSPQLG